MNILETKIENILRDKNISHPYDLAKITTMIVLHLREHKEDYDAIVLRLCGIVWTDYIEDYDQEIYDPYKNEDLVKILLIIKDENYINGIFKTLYAE